jgi:hypothetical protein
MKLATSLTIQTCAAIGSAFVLLAGCPADDEPDNDTGDSSTGPTTSSTTATTTTTSTTDDSATGTTSTTTDTSTATDPTSGGSGSSSGGPVCVEDVVELPGDMLFPEGIAAHSDGTLYVGSLTSGEILAITPCTGEGTEDVIDTFADGSDSMSVLGMLVDETNSMLWVCSSDTTGVAAGEIQGFDLDDGMLAFTHAFDAGLCNDLAFDGDGNLYATESFGSRIMIVDAADLLSDTDADEWSTDTDYAVNAGEFGLNGIAWDGADAMYVVNYQNNEMFEVGINVNGSAANPSSVDLGEADFNNPDGVKLEAADNFLVVTQGDSSLIRVTLDGAGNTVTSIDNTFDVPSTAVQVGTDAWVVESQLDHLLGGTDPELPFHIRRVAL